jgi:hypothetical protein
MVKRKRRRFDCEKLTIDDFVSQQEFELFSAALRMWQTRSLLETHFRRRTLRDMTIRREGLETRLFDHRIDLIHLREAERCAQRRLDELETDIRPFREAVHANS